MPLPIAHGLIGATIVAATRENLSFRKDWKAMLAGASIAVLPDLDLLLSWGLGQSNLTHGGFSHSIVFSCFLGVLAALLMRENILRSSITFSAAALSHALLDMATKKSFGGAALLWPLTPEKFRLGIIDYFEFYPAPGVEPLGPIIERALEICHYELLIFMPIFILTVWYRRAQDEAKRGMGLPRGPKAFAGSYR